MEKIFEMDKSFNEAELSSYNVEIPIIKIDFTNNENAILFGGIGAQIIVHKLDRLTMKVAPIVSCKLIEVSSGKAIQELMIMTTDFSTGPIRAPYDKTIKKELSPMNLQTGAYRLDIYAQWAMLPNPLGGYAIVGTGYLFTKDGSTFATEKFEPRQGSLYGEVRRSINF